MLKVYNEDGSSIIGFLDASVVLVSKSIYDTPFCDIECSYTWENKELFKEGALVGIDGIHGGTFRVHNPIYTGTRIKARCYGLYDDTKSLVIKKLTIENLTVEESLIKAKNACDSIPDILFESDFPDTVKITKTFTNTTLYSVIESIAASVGGHVIRNRDSMICVYQKIGQNLNDKLKYGLNIKSFKKTENWDNVCTKILPIWNDGITLDEGFLEGSVQYEVPYTKIVEFKQEVEIDDNIPVGSTEYKNILKQNLKESAVSYLETHSEPESTYEVEAYIDFNVDIGDIILVDYSKLSIREEMQIQEIQWDGIAGKYRTVKFGKVLPTIKGLYNDLSVRTTGDVSSSGIWHKLDLNEQQFSAYENKSSNSPEYKACNGMVNIRGNVTAVESIQTSTESLIIATGISEKFRPTKTVRTVCQGSGMNRWLCVVTTGGEVLLSRYGTTDYGIISSNTWLPINVTYLI